MQSTERHAHAEQCYVTTHQRAAALLQWFDQVRFMHSRLYLDPLCFIFFILYCFGSIVQVLNTQILKDLTEVNEAVKGKTLDLRRERINLIKAKVSTRYRACFQP